jgi:hypothetical protein
MATQQPTPLRPSFQPRAECDDVQTAYLLWKIAGNVRVAESGCWEWLGAKVKRGHGRIGASKKDQLVHRLVYELCVAHVPPSKLVCHRCDNPPCCNPAHLYAGTASDNQKDSVQRGNHYQPCPKGSKSSRRLSDDDVRAIRRRVDAGGKGIGQRLADEYKVSPELISNIVHRKRYARVSDLPLPSLLDDVDGDIEGADYP